MVSEREELVDVSRAVNSHDVDLIRLQLEQMSCAMDDCDHVRLGVAKSQASLLDLVDEPMLLSPSRGPSFRLRLSGVGDVLVVRVERARHGAWLTVKTARGDHSWQPAVQTILRRSEALSQTEWKRLSKALDEYGFWNRPPFQRQPPLQKSESGEILKPLGGFDGVTASLEGVESNRHQFILRSYSRPEPGLRELVNVFRTLASCESVSGE